MTKCLVAVAVLQLVEDKLLGLDDELCQHVPAFKDMRVIDEDTTGCPVPGQTKPACRPITIRHLMTHTSGISAHFARGIDGPKSRPGREMAWSNIYARLVKEVDSGEITSLAAWVDELSKLPLFSHPGKHYGYGYGYDVLGHLVEMKSGMSLAAFMKKRIFDPLGMRDTRWDLGGVAAKSPLAKRLAVLYRSTKSAKYGSNGKNLRLTRVDPEAPGAQSRWTSRCTLPSGGGAVSSLEGGLLSTLDDYARFTLTILAGGAHPTTGRRILSKAMANEMFVDQIALLKPRVGSSSCPYDDKGLGLCGFGELLRRGAPNWGEWFDGVPGVAQWGGAASTALKYDPNNGNPILVMVMAQAFPQDDGHTITELLKAAREAVRKVAQAM